MAGRPGCPAVQRPARNSGGGVGSGQRLQPPCSRRQRAELVRTHGEPFERDHVEPERAEHAPELSVASFVQDHVEHPGVLLVDDGLRRAAGMTVEDESTVGEGRSDGPGVARRTSERDSVALVDLVTRCTESMDQVVSVGDEQEPARVPVEPTDRFGAGAPGHPPRREQGVHRRSLTPGVGADPSERFVEGDQQSLGVIELLPVDGDGRDGVAVDRRVDATFDPPTDGDPTASHQLVDLPA
jgi:hypothetical protein